MLEAPPAMTKDFTAQVVQPLITCMNFVGSSLVGTGTDKYRFVGTIRAVKPMLVVGNARPF